MKIVFIDKPMQDANTIEKQLIDGRVVYWTVASECMIIRYAFLRKKDQNI